MPRGPITSRLGRILRAELRAAEERLRSLMEGTPGQRPAASATERAAADARREYHTRVARYYARLELPFGAPAAEVKRAYRRLMSRYHPDRFGADPEREGLANEVSLQLREAYEGVLEHLERAGGGQAG